jgi:hypothetical protein
MDKEFQKYATKGLGLSSMTLDRYRTATDAYINPTIIEERKLNVASMDVFSRLMMDRIIFLGVPIDDDVANIIQAQLLFLASTDSSADISLYIMLKPMAEWPEPRKTRDELLAAIQEVIGKIPGNNYEFSQPIQLRFNELISGAPPWSPACSTPTAGTMCSP